MGYYTDFKNRAKLRPSHRINTFAYANGATAGRAVFLCNQLEAKTFAFANAAFAYANPPRGDVSPCCRREAPFFDFAAGNRYRFCKILPSVNWTSAFADAVYRADPRPHIQTSTGLAVRRR